MTRFEAVCCVGRVPSAPSPKRYPLRLWQRASNAVRRSSGHRRARRPTGTVESRLAASAMESAEAEDRAGETLNVGNRNDLKRRRAVLRLQRSARAYPAG